MWFKPCQLCDTGVLQLCGFGPTNYVAGGTESVSNYVEKCQLCGLCSANYVDLPLQLCGPLSPFVQRRVDQNQGNFPIWPMLPCTYPQSLACWQCDSQHAAEESVDHWPMLSSAVYVICSGMFAGLTDRSTFPCGHAAVCDPTMLSQQLQAHAWIQLCDPTL